MLICNELSIVIIFVNFVRITYIFFCKYLKRVPRENIEDATNDTVQGTCQEHQEQIKQLKKNNETLLQNNQTLEKELRDLKKELKKEEIPPVIQPRYTCIYVYKLKYCNVLNKEP
jgi:uncharacterized protein YoxC